MLTFLFLVNMLKPIFLLPVLGKFFFQKKLIFSTSF